MSTRCDFCRTDAEPLAAYARWLLCPACTADARLAMARGEDLTRSPGHPAAGVPVIREATR